VARATPGARRHVVRIRPDLYIATTTGRFGPRAPSTASILHAVSSVTGETFAQHGATAANALRLTNQTPLAPIFLTSGRTRTLQVGGQKLRLPHAPGWKLLLPGHPAGDALRAIDWLGPENAEAALRSLARALPDEALSCLLAMRDRVPARLALTLSRLETAAETSA